MYLPSLRQLLTAPLTSQTNVALALSVRLFAVIILLIFSIIIIRGLYFSKGNWTEINAKVVANETHSSNPTLYTPIYTYSFNGREYGRHEGLLAKDEQYAIGSEVPILINPDNPLETRQEENTRLGTLVLLGFILIPCAVMIVRTFIEIRRLKTPNRA